MDRSDPRYFSMANTELNHGGPTDSHPSEALPYINRMAVETEELAERLNKLSAFMGTPAYDAVDDHEKSLIDIQLAAMKTYLIALRARLLRHT